MISLLIDTSTEALIIGLYRDLELIDYVFKIVERNHSVVLMPNIDNLIKRNDLTVKDIDEIIVGNGPGSYTGVRIGVTVAKTLSYTLNIPLKKVSTLQLMSASLIDKARYIAPLIDARRGNVFAALYKVENKRLDILIEDNLYSYSDLQNKIKEITNNQETHFVSNNNLEVKDSVFNFRFLEDVFNPKMIKYLQFIPINEVHTFVPNYKRKTEAEMNLNEN